MSMVELRYRRIISVLSISGFVLVAALPGSVADDPSVDLAVHEGLISWAVAWHVEPPEVGCLVVDPPPTPTPAPAAKTCGGIRGGGSVNGEVGTDVTQGVRTVVVELAWEDAVPGTTLQLDTFCEDVPRGPSGGVLDPDHPCYHDARGTSPLRIRVDEGDWTGGIYDPIGLWTSRVFAFAGTGSPDDGVGVGVALEQEFTLYTSVFYGEPAPDGYTAIP